jgi:alpha-L-fucosidase
MTNYDKVDILWYDMAFPLDAKGFESTRLNEMVLELQPGIIVNNRSGLSADFTTLEQSTNPAKGDWESCMTLNDNWGYSSAANNWKTARTVISNLVKCSSYGGNYQLNVGPRPDGSFPPESKKILHEVGEWSQRNGESIYGSQRSKVLYCSFGQFTRRANTLYAHVDYWLSPEIVVAGVKAPMKNARMLASSAPVNFTQTGDRIVLSNLPDRPPDVPGPVIAMEFETEPVQDTVATRIIYGVLPDLKPAGPVVSSQS